MTMDGQKTHGDGQSTVLQIMLCRRFASNDWLDELAPNPGSAALNRVLCRERNTDTPPCPSASYLHCMVEMDVPVA